MAQWFNVLLSEPSDDKTNYSLRQQRIAITNVVALACVLVGIGLFVTASSSNTMANLPRLQTLSIVVSYTALILGGLSAILVLRKGKYCVAALTLVTIVTTLLVIQALITQLPSGLLLSGIMVIIAFAGLVLHQRALAWLSLPTAIILISIGYLGSLIYIIIAVMFLYIMIVYTFHRHVWTSQPAVIDQVPSYQAKNAATSMKITQGLLSSRLNSSKVMGSVVSLIKHNVPATDVVQLYLIDKEEPTATLMATTDEQSKVLRSKVSVGSLDPVGRVTISGKTVILQDDESAADLTPQRIVLPLKISDQIIGALDILNKHTEPFSAQDVELFEMLAPQIAIVIDNARLYTDAQDLLRNNQRLYEQTKASLQEIERLNQQLTGHSWAEYLQSMTEEPAFSWDATSGELRQMADWTSTLAEASRRNDIVDRELNNQRVVAMPINVRGQVIGAIEFELPLERNLLDDEIYTLSQALERLGLTVENTRLLDEAQKLAQYETLINEIGIRMQKGSNTIDGVVSITAQSLAEAIQASRVAIRIGLPESVKNP